MWAVAAADMASGLMSISVSPLHVRGGWQLRARDALPAEVLTPRPSLLASADGRQLSIVDYYSA